MKETVISWTFVNWITIVSMFIVALVVAGLFLRIWQNVKNKSA